MAMHELLWSSVELSSSEHFVAELGETGIRLRGTVVLPIDDEPAHLTYEVVAEQDWRTRRADISVVRAGACRNISIVADGAGNWALDGQPVPALASCLDVDLGWTPATNTLAIRRLGLDRSVGDRGTLPVAWLRFPELVLERSDQAYERLGPSTWQYSSGDFRAALEVDDEGFVRRYGEDLWRAVAAA